MRKSAGMLLAFAEEYAVPVAEEKAREMLGAAATADQWAESIEAAL